MYGTIFNLKVKPGHEQDLLEIMDLFGSVEISKRIAIAIEKLSDRVNS